MLCLRCNGATTGTMPIGAGKPIESMGVGVPASEVEAEEPKDKDVSFAAQASCRVAWVLWSSTAKQAARRLQGSE
eukprot:1156799-Alexandrium_andersonii.AAC.1